MIAMHATNILMCLFVMSRLPIQVRIRGSLRSKIENLSINYQNIWDFN